jgi:hypothetical protein
LLNNNFPTFVLAFADRYMKKKLCYTTPKFEEVLIDAVTSLACGSEDIASKPGGNPVTPIGGNSGAQGSSTFKSEDTNKSFDEKNPFRE